LRPPNLALRARYVFPVDRPPIENGVVTIKDRLFFGVGRFPGDLVTDLGDVAIIPGLVNAHTHLEFSDLERPLGEPGMSLPWWIREVIKRRARAADVAQVRAGQSAMTADPIQQGIAESARCGVTTIGNITTELDDATHSLDVAQKQESSRSATPFQGGPPLQALDVAQYLELRALRYGDIESRLQLAAAFTANRAGAFFGLSPHAPYTVHQNLFHQLCDIATARRCPIAMHLAESREELQLLATSLGPFRDLLEERGWWEPGAIGLGVRPLEYLRRLAMAPCSLVIHGNYLNDEEIAFVAANRNTMSVVYCPRTHTYFGHEPYPLKDMLDRGVRVALGTDSRASNPDLDLRTEMQFIVERHGIAPAQAIEMATVNGATAMGMLSCGAITIDKPANLAVIQIPNRKTADPHELLFDPESKVVATICRGRVVFSEHPAL
jgi:cytosine/adenosine deaminase-related metal-dependent hydrolase